MLGLIIIALLLALALPASIAEAEPPPRGGFLLWGNPSRYGTEAALEALGELRATGADTVGLVATWYLRDGQTSALRPGWNTPADADLVATIAEAKRLGFRVILHLHVDSEDNTWRGYLDPPDKQGFFAGYGYFVRRYAALAERHGVDGLVVGSELVELTRPRHTERWLPIIADARQRFSGFLTYSAQWGGAGPWAAEDPLREYAHIEFWPELDMLGIAAYFALSDGADHRPDRSALVERWGVWRDDWLAPFQAEHEKPLIFTEVGYRSSSGAAARPWDSHQLGNVDLQLQADLYAALREAWRDVPWFAEVHFWYWSTNPNPEGLDQDFPPQFKPALREAAMIFGADQEHGAGGGPAGD